MKLIIGMLLSGTLYLSCFFPRWRQRECLVRNTVFYLYLAGVFYVTLMPSWNTLAHLFHHPYVPMNLMPFRDYVFRWGDYKRQIVLNVLMTVPFGFMLPRVHKIGFLRCIGFTFLLSLGIELLQPFVGRFSDITDLITNTMGGAMGYALHLLCRKAGARFRC